MSFKKFARDAAFVASAQVGIGVANFLILPIVTKTIGAHDYGLWIQILVTVTLLSRIALMEVQSALIRFTSSKTDKREVRDQFYTLFTFVTMVSTGIALLFMMLLDTIGITIGGGAWPIIAVMLLVPFSALGSITTAYFMATYQAKTYAILNMFTAFGQLFFILVLLNFGFGLVGVISGALLALFLSCIIALFIIIRQVGFGLPRFHLLRPNLKFSIPLTPNSIISWVSESSDRYLVALFLGLSAAGVYSAAYGIAALTFILVNPIQIVLIPTLSRLFDHDDISGVQEYLSRSLRYYFIIAIPATVGLTVLAEPILVALTTPEFASGSSVIPLVAMAGLLFGVFQLTITVVILVKKTHLGLIAFGVPALANVALTAVLIPPIGLVGAALATTISYAMMLMIGFYFSTRYITFSTNPSFIGKSVAAALIMAVALLVIDPIGMFQIVLCVGVGALVYFVTLLIVRGIQPEELDYVQGIIDVLLRRRQENNVLDEKEMK